MFRSAALSEQGLTVLRKPTDNYEWADGKHSRFGLYHTDFQTQKRTLRDGSKVLLEIIAKWRARFSMPAPSTWLKLVEAEHMVEEKLAEPETPVLAKAKPGTPESEEDSDWERPRNSEIEDQEDDTLVVTGNDSVRLRTGKAKAKADS